MLSMWTVVQFCHLVKGQAYDKIFYSFSFEHDRVACFRHSNLSIQGKKSYLKLSQT